MTVSDEEWKARSDLSEALEKNRKRRNRAAWAVDQAREELRDLLAEGLALGMKRTALARDAKISRKYTYTLVAKRSDEA